jgi:hypothetical protein
MNYVKLHNEEFHIFYSSPNVMRLAKPKGMKWAEHAACMG